MIKIKNLLLLIVVFLFIKPAFALPPLPTEYYGNITFYNNPVYIGANVNAIYGVNDTICGSFVVSNYGVYGSLSCMGDDSATSTIEGPSDGANISFTVAGQLATKLHDADFSSSSFKEVDLVVPQIVCGDGFCSNIGEDCNNCVFDCGSCNATYNESENATNATGGGGGTGGGGTGGGAVSSGGGGGGGGGGAVGNVVFGETLPEGQVIPTGDFPFCTEDWSCGNWSECTPEDLQFRICNDLNGCGTYDDKPPEKKACVYGINITKVNVTEEEPRPPRRTPLKVIFPKIVCEKELNPMQNGGIWFFLLILLMIFYKLYRLNQKIKQIKRRKDLKPIRKAKRIFSVKRKTYIFIGILLFFASILYLFYIFFFLCKLNLSALWILLAVIFLLPVLINRVLDYFEYHEHEKIVGLEELADTHFKEIKELIRIESENIRAIEKEIASMLKAIFANPAFEELITAESGLREIYDDVVGLVKDYEKMSVATDREARLTEEIYALANNQQFFELSERIPEVKNVYGKLTLLYSHYQEKQELYDEFAKAEEDVLRRSQAISEDSELDSEDESEESGSESVANISDEDETSYNDVEEENNPKNDSDGEDNKSDDSSSSSSSNSPSDRSSEQKSE